MTVETVPLAARVPPRLAALRSYATAVFAATALGLVLRLVNLGGQSSWYTLAPLHELFSNVARHENTPYPYYLLVWLWAHVFGHGEIALRSLSALAGAATVPVAAAATRVLAGARVGAAAAFLVAVNPFLIWYSQEARSYALFVFLAALALWFFARAMTTEGSPDVKALRWWAGCSALTLAVNYFAVFSIGAEGGLLLWRSSRASGREGVLRVLRMLVPPAIVGLLLIPLEVFQRHRSPVGDIAEIALGTRVIQIPKAFLIAYETPAKLIVTLLAGTLALISTVPVLSARGRTRTGAKIAACVAILAIVLPSPPRRVTRPNKALLTAFTRTGN